MNLLAQATSPAAAEKAAPAASNADSAQPQTPAPAKAAEPAKEAAAPASAKDVAAKIMDGAGSPKPAETTETATTAVMEVPDKAPGNPEPVTSVPPQAVFMMGVALLALFLWFFGTESAKRKRLVGTIIAIAVAAGSFWFYNLLGINKGIELRGGVAIRLKIQSENPDRITSETQDTVIKVLEKRFNATGVEELLLAPQGKDGIFLQRPAVSEQEVKDTIETATKAAKLEFAMTYDREDPVAAGMRAHSGLEVYPGYKALPIKRPGLEDKEEETKEPERYILVKMKPDMSGSHVTGAGARLDSDGWGIGVEFDSEGARQFGELSSANVDKMMAIILDGEVLSYPNFREPIWGGNCRISGGSFDRDEAIALAASMENPLEEALTVESVSRISPTMGKESVRQGVVAGIAGLLITLIFIVVYYRFSGFIALFSLCINIAMIFGAMALFKFTLTLPGIAGIILTIGIAIDASVIIYERLREEIAAGKSVPAAIQTAYEKAASAIIDANITTLFTTVILFAVATGTVKGFAVTLTIGIVATLFSTMLVSRVCFAWCTDTGLLKKINFLNIIPEKTIDFLSYRRPCIIGSAILFVISMALILIPSIDPRGVDLKGGDLITIQSHSDKLSVKKIQDSLSDLDLGLKPIVQAQHPMGAGNEFFTVRAGFEMGDKVIAEIEKDFGIELGDTTVDSVGSAVGDEMLRTSLLALGLGLLAILIYVTIRFEFAFALGAVVALFHDLIITLGLVTIFHQEVSLITVGAFLTVAGYSINDTIIIFDRVREGLRNKRGSIRDVMNYSMNATLGRTILTSSTTLIVVVVLFLFGGPALRNFSFTLIAGVVVGTYSSIFIASPIVLWWARKSGTNLRREILDADQGKVGPAAAKG